MMSAIGIGLFALACGIALCAALLPLVDDALGEMDEEETDE